MPLRLTAGGEHAPRRRLPPAAALRSPPPRPPRGAARPPPADAAGHVRAADRLGGESSASAASRGTERGHADKPPRNGHRDLAEALRRRCRMAWLCLEPFSNASFDSLNFFYYTGCWIHLGYGARLVDAAY